MDPPDTTEVYDYAKEMKELDEISKNLLDMKEEISNLSVHCHMLEVELATQFNPFTVEKLSTVVDTCNKCVKGIHGSISDEPSLQQAKVYDKTEPRPGGQEPVAGQEKTSPNLDTKTAVVASQTPVVNVI